MFASCHEVFTRMNLTQDQYQQVPEEERLFKVTLSEARTVYIYFPMLSVSSWSAWQNGNKQFQASYFAKDVQNKLEAINHQPLFVFCVPHGFDGDNLNKVHCYLTAAPHEYEEAGALCQVRITHKGPSYNHSDFLVVILKHTYQLLPERMGVRADIRTLLAPKCDVEQAYDRTIEFPLGTHLHRSTLIKEAYRFNLEEGDGLQEALNDLNQLLNTHSGFKFLPGLHTLTEPETEGLTTNPSPNEASSQTPPVVFTAQHQIPEAAEVRRAKSLVQTVVHHHIKIQRRLHRHLCEQHSPDCVTVEWRIGRGRQVDLAVCIDPEADRPELHLYEIKTADDAMTCVRQALGQLFEYQHLCGLDNFTITELYIVGPASNDAEVDAMLQLLGESLGYTMSYLMVTPDES